jgi:hypothetical protein
MLDKATFGHSIVIEQKNPIHALFERLADANIITSGITEIFIIIYEGYIGLIGFII